MNGPHPHQDRLLPFVCGELDARDTADFQAHLAGCPACAREVESQQRLDAVLRGAFARQSVDASAVRERVMRLVQADVATSRPARVTAVEPPAAHRWREQLREWMSTLRRPVPAFALAAAVVLFAVVLFALPGLRRGNPAVYAAVAADHYDIVVQRVKQGTWLKAEGAVREFTQAQFQDPTLAATLTPENGRFSRVCLRRLAGEDFAHFVYAGADGREAVSVFVRRRGVENPLPGRPAGRTAGGLPLYATAQGTTRLTGFDSAALTVLVVGELPPTDALRLARATAERLGS